MRWKSKIPGLLIITLLITISCAFYKDDSSRQNLPSAKLQYIDTIQFDTNNELVGLYVFDHQSFIGVNSALSKLFIYNSHGILKKIINEQGDGPEAYKKIIKFGFLDSDHIAIADFGKILVYNLSDGSKTICTFRTDEVFPLTETRNLFSSDGRNLVFATADNNLSPESEQYFEKTHTITSISSSDCSFRHGGGYPTQSIYREKFFPNHFGPRLAIAPNRDRIFQLFPYDQILFVFSSDSLKLLDKINLSPQFFGDITHKNGSDPSTQLFLIQKNSSYKGLVIGKNKIITHYRMGLEDEKITSSLVMANQQKEERAYFLEVYDRQGRKLCQDIRTGGRIAFLVGCDENDNIILQRSFDPGNEKEPEGLVVYKCNVQIEE